MRRRLAIAMAALVALSIGGLAGGRAPSVQAGGGSGLSLSVDCDVSTGGIQAGLGNCTYASGTTTFAADVYLTNGSGSSIFINGMTITLGASQLVLTPTTPACSPPRLDCNPDFNEGLGGTGWSCDPVFADQDPSANNADSGLSCINSNLNSSALANGNSILLFRVSYSAVDGLSDLTLKDATVFDETASELMSCNPVLGVSGTCNDAQMVIGAVVATFTPTNTPTVTPTVCPVDTPGCPTATSQAFVTVTPTPCPVGATDCPTPTPGTEPTTSGEATLPPPPPPPPAGGAPGGTTGGAGAGRITLPDTGQSDEGGSSTWIALLAGASALGAAGIASGMWFSARRRQEED